jgi:ATP-dependent DNA helicase DinG
LKDFFSNTLIKHGKNLRKSQLELSQDIEESYSNNKIFVAEAEVGTGKTYAYLIPALNKIYASKKPFLISTGTIVLQEQLSLKDIPDINKYLITEGFTSTDIVSCIGKGKEHYICEKRLIECDIYEEQLDNIKNLYERKNIFDRSQINLEFNESLWKRINVKYCNRQRCQYRECLYRKMKMDQENFNYDFLICNHQYFLACIKDGKKDFISKFSGIVIDEAHNFEQAAFSILGGNKSLDDFINCIEHISYELSKNYGHGDYNDRVENAYRLADLLYT